MPADADPLAVIKSLTKLRDEAIAAGHKDAAIAIGWSLLGLYDGITGGNSYETVKRAVDNMERGNG